MFLRKMRWLSACVLAAVAMLAAPSMSKADTSILIQELDGTGSPVGPSQVYSGSPLSTLNFIGISVTPSPSPNPMSQIGSLSTGVSSGLADSFDSTHSLQVTVTVSNYYVNPFPGQPADIKNSASASTGIVGGTNLITGTTTVSSLNGSVGPTDPSTASYNSNGGTAGDLTKLIAPDLPANYSISQTITVRATPDSTGSIQSGSTVGGSVGSTVQTNAAMVPAPAGLVLALAAIPALGLRRILRRNA